MNEPFAWWLLIVGIGIGIALMWLVTGRLARAEDDVAPDERVEEASWISRTIAAYGGEAPPELVEEILELHARYLRGPALDPAHGAADEGAQETEYQDLDIDRDPGPPAAPMTAPRSRAPHAGEPG